MVGRWPHAGATVSLFRRSGRAGPSIIVGFYASGITWSLHAFLPESMDELRDALWRQEMEMDHEGPLLNWILDRLAAAEVVTDALLGSGEEAKHAV